MPRYFFHIDGETPDAEGLELSGIGAARSEAIRAAGEMLRDIDGAFDGQEWAMRVTEADRLVLTLRFSAIEHT